MPIETTTRQQVIVLLAIGFAVLISNTVFSLWLGQRTANFIEHLTYDQSLKTSLTRLLSAAQDAETGQRGFMLTGELPYLEPYNQALVEIPRQLKELHRLAEGHAQLNERLPELEATVDRRMAFIDKSVAAMRSGNNDDAVEQLRSGQGKIAMDRLRALTAELIQRQDAMIREGVANIHGSQDWGRFINLATLGLIIILAVATGIVVRRFISDLEQTQEELRALNQGLEQTVEERAGDIMRANEEIQRFAYIVSHDLRAPLVNIMGFTSEVEAIGKMIDRQYEDLLARGPDLVLAGIPEAVKEDLPEAIGFIRASTAKMDRLINAILGLSREGRRVLTPVSVDMTRLVSDIAASLQHQVETAGGEIVVGPLPGMVTDKLAIEQIFSNLIENGVKYTDERRAPRIEIQGQGQGAHAHFTVRDNGRGIEEKDMERIFELFRRAGKQDRPGEGLGLAFVRAAVRRLGGSIAVRSSPGEGTTFDLRFPLRLKQDKGVPAHG